MVNGIRVQGPVKLAAVAAVGIAWGSLALGQAHAGRDAPLAGSWLADVRGQAGGQDVRYELEIASAGRGVVGRWSIEGTSPQGASWSQGGCLRAPRTGRVTPFAACVMDGSSGARDAADVCPQYAAAEQRLVLKGAVLIWETRAEDTRSWRALAKLRRAEARDPLQWDEAECGPR